MVRIQGYGVVSVIGDLWIIGSGVYELEAIVGKATLAIYVFKPIENASQYKKRMGAPFNGLHNGELWLKVS